MTDFKNAKQRLYNAISWVTHETRAEQSASACQEVEDAITALDNAAYDRAYKQRHEQCSAACLVRERDRLKQDLEFAEHRREQAEKEHERLQAELADAQSDLGIRDRDSDDHADDAIRLREELAEARDTTRRLTNAHADVFTESLRLRKALETLADRYHARVCNRKLKVPIHHRGECGEKPYGVVLAEKALAGASESKPMSEPSRAMMAVVEELEAAAQRRRAAGLPSVLFDDRKPQEGPEIEAVLMGTIVLCACKCGRVVEVGQCAYRHVKSGLATPPLYASEACARKAARPKARTHPPYAAYTDAMRREEDEETSAPPEAPKMKVVYECSHRYPSGRICGWTGGNRDRSPTGRCPRCFREVRIGEKLS